VGEPVVFGIRPEHLTDRRLQPDGSADNVLKARVDVVEPLGNETLLYLAALQAPEEPVFIARVSADSPARPGEAFEAVVDITKAHVFEKRTGERLS
jgi:multiple sugar transport system ATP-binding protein